MRTCVATFLLLILSPIVVAQTPAEPLRTAGDRPIDIQHIRLNLRVNLPLKKIDAVAYLRFGTLSPVKNITLDAVGFEVQHVLLSLQINKDRDDPAQEKPRVPLKFRHDSKKLHIELPAEWPAEKEGWLVIEYAIRDPKQGLFFFGPTAAEPDVPLTVWSQGEAITNRYWIPCLDHPDQWQTTEMFVTAAEGYEVLSNGKLMEKRANKDKTVTFHWKQDKPHVSYLVTLVVGQFAIVEEKGPVPLLYYVPVKRKDEVSRTFGRTREMMEFFSKRFGMNYPWEKYAQVVVEQFTSGGMENTSATTLNDRALHDERAFLDSSPDGLIAHELAHQWWGDLVTCRDWAHIWLNEGFASFCEVVWSEYKEGREEADYNLILKGRAAMNGGKERPVVDRRYASPRMMFDARAYPKGAWVLQMLRARLGEEAFWKSLRVYGNEHKFKSVETADLRRTMERVTGKNLERFFHDWTDRPGHPVLDVTTEYLAESKQLKIVVKQTQAGEPFHFPLPIKIDYLQRGGGPNPPGGPLDDGRIRQITLQVKDREQVAYVSIVGSGVLGNIFFDEPQAVLIDPELTVLAEFNETKSRDLWANQLRSSSVISRIRAAAYFGKQKTTIDRELLAKALKNEKFWGVGVEIANALAATGSDIARDALIEGLKHAHPKVRRSCADHLAKFPKDLKVATALKVVLTVGDPSYFVEAAALTSFAVAADKNAIDALLPWLAKNSYYDVLRVGALTGLGNSKDLGALDTLLTWTKRGKSRPARIAALLALSKLAQATKPSEEQRKAILDAIVACVTGDGEMPQVRRNAVTAMLELGPLAASRVDALEALQRNDPDEYVQDLTAKAIEKLKGGSSGSGEIGKLRDELQRIKQQNQLLQDRLERLEKLEKKGQ